MLIQFLCIYWYTLLTGKRCPITSWSMNYPWVNALCLIPGPKESCIWAKWWVCKIYQEKEADCFLLRYSNTDDWKTTPYTLKMHSPYPVHHIMKLLLWLVLGVISGVFRLRRCHSRVQPGCLVLWKILQSLLLLLVSLTAALNVTSRTLE